MRKIAQLDFEMWGRQSAVEYLENINFPTARLSLLPIFLFVLAITHTQEALFVFVLIVGIVIWRTARTCERRIF